MLKKQQPNMKSKHEKQTWNINMKYKHEIKTWSQNNEDNGWKCQCNDGQWNNGKSVNKILSQKTSMEILIIIYTQL
jgi:hypothetical protein